MPITKITLEPKNKKANRKDNISYYNIDFDQRKDDRTGKPIGNPVLTTLTVRIERSSEVDVPFYLQWQLDPTKVEDLDICFYENLNLKRTIKIEKSFLVSYDQSCSQAGTIEETLITVSYTHLTLPTICSM